MQIIVCLYCNTICKTPSWYKLYVERRAWTAAIKTPSRVLLMPTNNPAQLPFQDKFWQLGWAAMWIDAAQTVVWLLCVFTSCEGCAVLRTPQFPLKAPKDLQTSPPRSRSGFQTWLHTCAAEKQLCAGSTRPGHAQPCGQVTTLQSHSPCKTRGTAGRLSEITDSTQRDSHGNWHV